MNYSKESCPCPKSSTYSVHERPSDSEVEDGILGSMIAIVYVQLSSAYWAILDKKNSTVEILFGRILFC